MNIFAINLKSYGIEYVTAVFRNMGHFVTLDSVELDDTRISSVFDQYFLKKIAEKNYDMVFTFNYYPVISNNCQKHHIKYVSWVYDSPHVNLYSYTLINSCNYIFLFDKTTYTELKNGGISTVYYLPLASNVNTYDSLKITSDIQTRYQSDVSFVGSLYNEKHCLYRQFDILPPYVKGYLDGIIQAQSKIYGYFFLQEFLSPDIVKEMQKAVPYPPNKDGIETAEYVYAHCFLARRVTEIERHDLLKAVSQKYDLKVYTSGDTSSMPHVRNMGPVDYYNTMPYIFKCSKINLNITLKSILSGIPLRAMDILGCGGFLLSNYQADFLDYFVPGEDFAIYESEQHLLEQIHYYLNHEDERQMIAGNGYQKVKQFHTYERRLSEILNLVFH